MSALKPQVTVGTGIVSYEHLLESRTIFTFFADINIDGRLINAESAIDYDTEELADQAAQEFTIRFPLAFMEDPMKAVEVLKEYQMGVADEVTPPDSYPGGLH